MKRWIRRWLGLDPAQDECVKQPGLAGTIGGSGRTGLESDGVRNMFEIIEAENGRILVYNQNKFNPNGPDKNKHTIWIVQPEEDIMNTIKTAIVTARLS